MARSAIPAAARSPATEFKPADSPLFGPPYLRLVADHLRELPWIAWVNVVRFGDQYKQWNAAFDAGFAAALGKPIVTLHQPDHDHALKEIDRAAEATAESPEQVVEILRYVLDGQLAR